MAIPKVLYFILKYWIMVHSVLWMSRMPSSLQVVRERADGATVNLDPSYTGRACNAPFDRNGSA